ncbi:uncharacterized protein LOC119615643 [Lucilia sericata]|uniref:uncharacterized protein LOC119615643 n=1 Tax=Lucilia sericata TaxID=13632 RepID=UPI0018A82047|nr:uncharacterized protein LOC119615643 [Lucilia sericata]
MSSKEEQTPPPGVNTGGIIHTKELQRKNYLNRVLEEVRNISNYSTLSIHQLEVKLSLLERQLESFEKVQGHLESLDDSQFEQNHRLVFEDAYFKLKSEILKRLSMHQLNFSEPSMSSTHLTTLQHSTKPQLPTLQLTKFSGNYNDWIEFYNMFGILVHNNADLSPISKFQYLRSCLTDSAARLIQSLDITPENYNKALDILKSRYDNKRLIFQSHMQNIFAIKELSKPKVNIVREFIDSVNANIRALQSIASDKQIADGIILYLITSKLVPETQAKWEEEIFTFTL